MTPTSYIIGTAGHVDHGKTTLIKALTGIDTDRLPEEKARGLSIDLGFAHLVLPSGKTVGIVDVPGHERFLKNMLAGVGGYDLALLVIDSMEGVKPQTREHLEILQMLSIKSGVVALTKVDVQDPEYLPLVREEVSAYLSKTFLKDSPIVDVSAVTGQGLDELKATIDRLLVGVTPRVVAAPFRMPIDRVFVKDGFGTVLTGSMWSGQLARGDRVEILPQGIEARVRQLQVFGKTEETAYAGQRVAVNLAGMEADTLHRGQVLTTPGSLKATQVMDLQVEVLPISPHPLKNRAWVRMYVGTQEVLGKLILLESDEVEAGRSGLAQIHLDEPTVAQRFDRFVLRNITAQFTAGGGMVLDTSPPPHRRKDQRVVEILMYKGEGEQVNLMMAQFLQDPRRFHTAADLTSVLKLNKGEVEGLLSSLADQREIVSVHEGRSFLLGSTYRELEGKLSQLLGALQKSAPHRGGWRREEISKMLSDYSNKLVDSVLLDMAHRGALKEVRERYSTADHVPALDANQQQACKRLLDEILKTEFAPPATDELRDFLRLEPKLYRTLLEHLLETGTIVYISKDIYFLSSTLQAVRQRVADYITTNGSMSPAQARDLLTTTRKYVIPLLEYLDETRFTRRSGDNRILA